MKVNFKEVRVEVKFGEPETMDTRQVVGNTINARTADIGLADLAREIYYSEEPVEVPERYRSAIVAIIREAGNIIAAGKKAIIAALTPEAEEKEEKTNP